MKADLTYQLNQLSSGTLAYILKDNEEFKSVLLEEFQHTPKKRDFNKYLKTVEHITSQLKAHQEGKLHYDLLAKKNFDIDYHEQRRVFYAKKDSEILDKYLSHSLKEATTYKTLCDIEVLLDIYKDQFAAPGEKAETIITFIESLNSNIREAVATEIINYTEIGYAVFLVVGEGNSGEWERSKTLFKGKMIEYIKGLPKVTNQRKFYSYISDGWAEKVECFLNDQINGSKPKYAVRVFGALEKLNIMHIPEERDDFCFAARKEFDIKMTSPRNESMLSYIRLMKMKITLPEGVKQLKDLTGDRKYDPEVIYQKEIEDLIPFVKKGIGFKE